MIIQLKKFGTTLVSRPAGKEALLAFEPTLNQLDENEDLIIDFTGVMVLSPSWADEFLTPLNDRYGKRMQLHDTENLSVKETLLILPQFKDKFSNN